MKNFNFLGALCLTVICLFAAACSSDTVSYVTETTFDNTPPAPGQPSEYRVLLAIYKDDAIADYNVFYMKPDTTEVKDWEGVIVLSQDNACGISKESVNTMVFSRLTAPKPAAMMGIGSQIALSLKTDANARDAVLLNIDYAFALPDFVRTNDESAAADAIAKGKTAPAGAMPRASANNGNKLGKTLAYKDFVAYKTTGFEAFKLGQTSMRKWGENADKNAPKFYIAVTVDRVAD